MNKIQLPKQQRDNWLQALRSGKYQQSNSCLFDHSNGGYCCLGVFCKVEKIFSDNEMVNYGMPKVVSKHHDKEYDLPIFLQGDFDDINELSWGYFGGDIGEFLNKPSANKKNKITLQKDIISVIIETGDTNTYSSLLAWINDAGFSFKQIANFIEETTVGV